MLDTLPRQNCMWGIKQVHVIAKLSQLASSWSVSTGEQLKRVWSCLNWRAAEAVLTGEQLERVWIVYTSLYYLYAAGLLTHPSILPSLKSPSYTSPFASESLPKPFCQTHTDGHGACTSVSVSTSALRNQKYFMSTHSSGRAACDVMTRHMCLPVFWLHLQLQIFQMHLTYTTFCERVCVRVCVSVQHRMCIIKLGWTYRHTHKRQHTINFRSILHKTRPRTMILYVRTQDLPIYQHMYAFNTHGALVQHAFEEKYVLHTHIFFWIMHKNIWWTTWRLACQYPSYREPSGRTYTPCTWKHTNQFSSRLCATWPLSLRHAWLRNVYGESLLYDEELSAK